MGEQQETIRPKEDQSLEGWKLNRLAPYLTSAAWGMMGAPKSMGSLNS